MPDSCTSPQNALTKFLFSSSAFIYMYLSLYFWVAAQMKKKKQKDDDDPRDYFKDNREDIYLIYIGV